MKKKLLFTLWLSTLFCLILSFSAFAADTNEFGALESIDGIDLTDMNEDTNARVVLVDSDGVTYHTYPARYVVTNATKFAYDFTRIKNANGVEYTKNSVVRIEVPDNILIAPNCGVLSQTSSLVEIKFSPDSQLTTLEYGCFYNNKKLQKLNIPKNVTTIGTLIIKNSSALEELVFDDGFSAVLPADSFTSSTNIKIVKFSNQMTTIDKKAFHSSFTNLSVLYAGENLADFGAAAVVDAYGSDGGNFSYTDGPISIYASEKLFANLETIERGRLNGWTGTRLVKGVIFYTGTKEQAQALIDKAQSDTPIFTNATLVEHDTAIADSEYIPTSGWNIVYNYNKCSAFYGNEHTVSDEKLISFDGEKYLSEMTVSTGCSRNCGHIVSSETVDSLFVCKGYSVSGSSILQGFAINRNLIEKYEQIFGKINFGLVAAVSRAELNTDTGNLISADGTVANQKVAFVDMTDRSYDIFEMKINGLTDYADTELYCCAYAIIGNNVAYLDNDKTLDNASATTLNTLKNQSQA
ncbi:MAG: leucine-rich repeat protein [Clostridia bacterium]|nr:leucine-rich repeat protein [Clostridia bacterium]